MTAETFQEEILRSKAVALRNTAKRCARARACVCVCGGGLDGEKQKNNPRRRATVQHVERLLLLLLHDTYRNARW